LIVRADEKSFRNLMDTRKILQEILDPEVDVGGEKPLNIFLRAQLNVF
jgi:predicted nucleotidyltransferase